MSIKEKTDIAIAKSFESRLACLEKDIAIMQVDIANLKKMYKRMTSEDQETTFCPDSFANQLVDNEVELNRLTDKRAAVAKAYDTWKSFAGKN